MFARFIRLTQRLNSSAFFALHKRRNAAIVSCYALTGLAASVRADSSPKEPITILEPSEFTHTFQIRQAANGSVDSSIKLLSCCIQTLQTGYSEYTALLSNGIMWISMAIETNSLTTANTVMEDELLRIRSELSNLKSHVAEMLFMYEEIRTLVNTAIGISFLAGCETTSGLASSHLYNCQQEVDKMKNNTEDLERRYMELQQELIKKTKPKQ